MSNFDSQASFEKYGYTLGGFFESVRSGFLKAYEEGQTSGFNPDGALSDDSKVRVLTVLDALQAQYGSVDLKPLGPLAAISAIGLFQALNDVLHGFEAYVNAKPEDFVEVRDQVNATRAALSLAEIGGYSGQAN